MAAKKVTDATRAQIAELREKGWSRGRIGQKFQISDSYVDWICLEEGADLPPARRRVCTTTKAVYQRGNYTVRQYTDAEDEKLLALRAAGSSVRTIMRETGRARTSIRGRLLTLARRQARAEEATAHG